MASLGPAIASTSSTSSSATSSSSSSSSSSSEARFAGIKTLSDLPSYPKDFVLRRLVVFVGIVIGYACYYLTRNSLTYAAPVRSLFVFEKNAFFSPACTRERGGGGGERQNAGDTISHFLSFFVLKNTHSTTKQVMVADAALGMDITQVRVLFGTRALLCEKEPLEKESLSLEKKREREKKTHFVSL